MPKDAQWRCRPPACQTPPRPVVLGEKGSFPRWTAVSRPDFKIRGLKAALSAEVYRAACAIGLWWVLGYKPAVTPLVRVPRLQQRSSAQLSP
jgi:hypothetical protein